MENTNCKVINGELYVKVTSIEELQDIGFTFDEAERIISDGAINNEAELAIEKFKEDIFAENSVFLNELFYEYQNTDDDDEDDDYDYDEDDEDD